MVDRWDSCYNGWDILNPLPFVLIPDNVPGLIPYGIGTGHHGHTGASPGKGNPASIPYGPRTGIPVIYPQHGEMDLAH